MPLTKCHNVPGVVVSDSGPYLVGYRHLTVAAVGCGRGILLLESANDVHSNTVMRVTFGHCL